MIVSRYWLKFFVSRIRPYCKQGALTKTICASGAPIVFTFFLDSKSCIMLVCIVQRIFRSILVGKFILPRSQRYFRGILYTYFESIWLANLSSQSSRLSSVLNALLSLLWLLLSSLSEIITGFCCTKDLFQSFLESLLANV